MSNTEKKDGWVGVLNGRPKTGQFSERSRTTKMADIQLFTEMTGDKNPVHYDKELAKKTPFGANVASVEEARGQEGGSEGASPLRQGKHPENELLGSKEAA